MTFRLFYVLAFLALTSCIRSAPQNKNSIVDSLQITDADPLFNVSENFETTEIICDTVYKNKGYKVFLKTFDLTNEAEFNTIFTLSKIANGQYSEIFRDSIFNVVQEVKFEDFNKDKVRDILVQNISDVRSNWTYYLYLVDTANDKLKRIKGFEEIKNPNYVPKYDLIDNYVMSGRNWTSFYKIQGDSIKHFDIVIYDGENENGRVTYDKDYKKAIATILAGKKNDR